MKSACERFKEWFETLRKTHHCPTRDETIMELIARVEALEKKGSPPLFWTLDHAPLNPVVCSRCGREGQSVLKQSEGILCPNCVQGIKP